LVRIIRGIGRLVLAFGRKRAVATDVHEVVEEIRKGVQSFGAQTRAFLRKDITLRRRVIKPVPGQSPVRCSQHRS